MDKERSPYTVDVLTMVTHMYIQQTHNYGIGTNTVSLPLGTKKTKKSLVFRVSRDFFKSKHTHTLSVQLSSAVT